MAFSHGFLISGNPMFHFKVLCSICYTSDAKLETKYDFHNKALTQRHHGSSLTVSKKKALDANDDANDAICIFCIIYPWK